MVAAGVVAVVLPVLFAVVFAVVFAAEVGVAAERVRVVSAAAFVPFFVEADVAVVAASRDAAARAGAAGDGVSPADAAGVRVLEARLVTRRVEDELRAGLRGAGVAAGAFFGADAERAGVA